MYKLSVQTCTCILAGDQSFIHPCSKSAGKVKLILSESVLSFVLLPLLENIILECTALLFLDVRCLLPLFMQLVRLLLSGLDAHYQNVISAMYLILTPTRIATFIQKIDESGSGI